MTIEATKKLQILDILGKIAWWLLLIYTVICGYMISDLYKDYVVEPGDYQILTALFAGLFITAFIHILWNRSTNKILTHYINNYVLSRVNTQMPMPAEFARMYGNYNLANNQSDIYAGTPASYAPDMQYQQLNEINSDDDLPYETEIGIDADVAFALLLPDDYTNDCFLCVKNLDDPVASLKSGILRDFGDEDDGPCDETDENLSKLDFSLAPAGTDVVDVLLQMLSYGHDTKVKYLREWAEDYYAAVEDKIGRPYNFYTSNGPLTQEQKQVLGYFANEESIENILVAEYPNYLFFALIYKYVPHNV